MSQNSMVIGNADGATVRAAINSALQALVGNSSGTTAPATTYAYMPWADTTSGLLKMRNGANTAWVTIGTLDAIFLGLADLATAQTWTKAQRGAIVALTDGATITPDFAEGNNFSVTLGGSRTLANPTNLVAGQSGVIHVSQDATGGRALSFGSYWKFENGDVPTLTATANALDVLAYEVKSTTLIVARLMTDVK